MNQAKCNEELIIPMAEQKLSFFGDSTFPVITGTTTMVTLSTDNIINPVSSIKI